MSSLLFPFGKIYGWVMDARNALYDRGYFRSYDLGARTVSVGNLTTGGTGKTPLVALIAEILSDAGETVCILTRGYGRKNPGERVLVSDSKNVFVDAETGGDEPVELARKLIGKAIVIADGDRVSAGTWAKETFGITTFILDDGFQHRRVRRDLDIVCVDATNPCGNGHILPAGNLRESFSGLGRAGAVVITRSDLVESTESLRERLKNRNAQIPIFESSSRVSAVSALKDFLTGTDGIQSKIENAFAFCGLGNPDNFRKMLEKHETKISGFRAFGDHKSYTAYDINAIEAEARSVGATSLLTTAKDAVKLADHTINLPVFVVEIKAVVNDDDSFRDLLASS